MTESKAQGRWFWVTAFVLGIFVGFFANDAYRASQSAVVRAPMAMEDDPSVEEAMDASDVTAFVDLLEPAGARVWIDGISLATTLPLLSFPVPAGEHQFSVEEGAVRSSFRVRLFSEQRVDLTDLALDQVREERLKQAGTLLYPRPKRSFRVSAGLRDGVDGPEL